MRQRGISQEYISANLSSHLLFIYEPLFRLLCSVSLFLQNLHQRSTINRGSKVQPSKPSVNCRRFSLKSELQNAASADCKVPMNGVRFYKKRLWFISAFTVICTSISCATVLNYVTELKGMKKKEKSSKEDKNQRFLPVEGAGADKLLAGGGLLRRACKQIPVA